MSNINDIYTILTARNGNQSRDLNHEIFEFARQLGWNPSYFLPADSFNEDFSNGYLSVEHGLENTAVLAFLNRPYTELSPSQRRKLDSIAYSNLVSWLIPIDRNSFSYIYILNSEKRVVQENKIYSENLDGLKSESFLQVVGKRPNPNIPALDDALMSTISYWKRNISSELDSLNNEILSSLFNALIFVRAVEDNAKRYKRKNNRNQLLLEKYTESCDRGVCKVSEIIRSSIKELYPENISKELVDYGKLKLFDSLDKYTVNSLLQQFYETADGKFSYDFSIMTKHALSRVYEKYVTVLSYDEKDLTLFKTLPVEKNINKFQGSFYTPEYIARFFSKYLMNEIPFNKFDELKICEPAVGSGMFLRTLLEVLYESVHPNYTRISEEIFQNITAIDIDPNACHATRLSLSLLHLLVYDKIPKKLNILNQNSIGSNTTKHKSCFDVVISNPPFVRYENANNDDIKSYLGDMARGKVDLYHAFIKFAVDALKPGGYGLFVLPHSFLVNNGTLKLRRYLSENTSIKFLADLSSVQVFGNISTYVILLIFQKKDAANNSEVIPQKLKCRSMVGSALDDALRGIEITNNNYSIYFGQPSEFLEDEWFVLPPKEYGIGKKFQHFPQIDRFMDVSGGIISGADDIFIVDKYQVPKGEESIFKPFLADREIAQYNLKEASTKYIFYPYLNGIHLTKREIESKFPKTWGYLLKHKSKLEKRKSLPREWWMLRSSIQPGKLFVPKIVNPELSITPRFSLDVNGQYVVSHSSFMKLKDRFSENDLLYYFLGVLNSTPCYWYISTHSNKYGSGYNKIQPKTLKKTPIPDPFMVEKKDLLKLIRLVKNRIKGADEVGLSIEKEIDLLVCSLYGLTEEETNLLLGI